MKKEDWTSELRDRLADYKEPVPEEIWEGIESKLPNASFTRKKPVILWRYIAAAAILMLAVAGADLLWYDNNKNSVTTVKHFIKKTHKTIVEQGEDIETIATTRENSMHIANIPELPAAQQSEEQATTDCENHITQNSESPKTEAKSQKPITNKQTNKSSKPKTKTKRPELSASLYTYNPIGSSQMSSSGVIASSNVVNSYTYASMAKKSPLYLHDYKEEAEHKQPVSLGLSLSYSLTGRLWLESGVVYTRLSSTFTHRVISRSLSDKQTLQYVGVPLRIGYNMWKNKRLNVYAIAGGEADVNVKAEMETEGVTRDIGKDRIQWSLNAAAGLQYNFFPQFGLYVEPGVRYYIDNGSNVDNIFKDKKLDFSIQVGLRCLLNK